MPNSRNSSSAGKQFDISPRESGDDSEDESEILEESPCGRWLKRREEVDQRDVPGIDCVHLAMDTEEGVEVVWNEMQLSAKTDLKQQETQIRQMFENLLHLDHENIVKFHRYWTDMKSDKPRVIFITEYMSSGSMKQFLKLTKRKAKRLPLQAWRRWCTQILSALSYLHSCTPPVIHGNLTCDTLFIQHNGLVKIGSVVPDAIYFNVKKSKEVNSRHLMAPEYERNLSPAVDIYSFGMCALEMAALEIQQNTDSTSVNEESILRTINSLECELQRDLIFKCLKRNPDERPSAHELLFHPLIFEVHSLKLLSAHCLVFSPKNRTQFSETIIDEMMQRCSQPDIILGRIPSKSGEELCYRLADVPSADKLEKFVEDVKFGVYPLTAFASKKAWQFRSRAVSPEAADSVKSVSPEPVDIETRRIVNMMCSVKAKENSKDLAMTILLRMDDKMNRQLTCQVTETDTAADLTSELVRLGFVHLEDQDKICNLLEDTLRGGFGSQQQTIVENSALNEPSSDSGIKSVSSNPTAVERNWSVADTESPSNPTAGGAGSNEQTPSSSGGLTTDFSTPTASSSQSTEHYLGQDQLSNVPLPQQQPQQQQHQQNLQQQIPQMSSDPQQQQQQEQQQHEYQNTIVSSTTDVGKQQHSSQHPQNTQQ
ncbi:nuclear receptor-binding protein homolog isoform X2 [Eupeodes corollae]|uniref:nuclear receptor-binding protein homolog isoform X2 n=1 Tax=Eupeodes corollae TaxID=290404 RepID=UPI0024921C31|nr:nuclear receptor-binding protein homolog isoform X2 [Eupeodes corollae]